MYISKDTYNGSTFVPVESLLAQERIITVNGAITAEKADEFAAQMLYLSLTDKNSPIKLLINSEGGEIDAGLMMCDIVSQCPCPVNAYCLGKAYSMGAVLFESVNGQRYMVGHSKLMLHQPSISGTIHKNAAEVEELSSLLKEKNDLLLSIVSTKSGLSLSKLKKETATDHYYSAEEAVTKGLADNIVTFADLAS